LSATHIDPATELTLNVKTFHQSPLSQGLVNSHQTVTMLDMPDFFISDRVVIKKADQTISWEEI